MAHEIRRVSYFYTRVRDEPGEGYRVLTRLAELGLSLQAFTAVPVGPTTTQLTLFPDDDSRFLAEVKRAGLLLDGPYPAILVQGDDSVGALVEVHEKLYQEGISVFSSTGLSAGGGRYGFLLYLRAEDMERAARALGI